MNAESLIGKVLGTCTLQKMIGQGGMGVVLLAQQSRPKRQVAVKVLLPAARLTPQQQAAFLERFRRETDAAAALEHPNILPVHEYGERDGLAYLVMPYVSGGTLRDELEREGQLPLAKTVSYLDQLAAALDVAHERGVIHRDVKPANILMTPEGRLLLTDFGLVKIIAEGQASQTSITGAGVPLGTPDYMAPEQVMGGEIDERADLYALGIVLYQMVTGKTPFKGDMPMQIAMQHLHSSPPPPSALREDLPATAEQVMLRVLAKNPADRYMSAQDLASAFRLALAVSGVELTMQTVSGSGPLAPGAESRFFTPRGLFDPSWQTGKVPTVEQMRRTRVASSAVSATSLVPLPPRSFEGTSQNDIVSKSSMTPPSFSDFMSPTNASNPYTPAPLTSNAPLPTSRPTVKGSNASDESKTGNTSQPPIRPRLVHKTGLLRSTNNEGMPAGDPQSSSLFASTYPTVPTTPASSGEPPRKTRAVDPVSPLPTSGANGLFGASASSQGNTGTLTQSTGEYSGQGATTTMKLTQSFKLVQVPVAGQPGQYVTGLLPVLPETQDSATSAEPTPSTQSSTPSLAGLPLRRLGDLRKYVKVIVLVTAALLVLLGSGTFWLVRTRLSDGGQRQTVNATPNAMATTAVQATASVEANTILSDSLSDNSHNWPVTTGGAQTYVFKDKAYHITNNDTKSNAAIALLPEETLPGSFVYTLKMKEMQGDDNSMYNQFGLIFRFNVQQKNGKTYKMFYIFEVANTKGGEYQLSKYDDSANSTSGPWSTIWSGHPGSEYHPGHGANSVNIFSVAVNGNKFVLTVNGKKVGTAQDGSLKGGQIGMLVNWKGTEVAFSNLLLTYK